MNLASTNAKDCFSKLVVVCNSDCDHDWAISDFLKVEYTDCYWPLILRMSIVVTKKLRLPRQKLILLRRLSYPNRLYDLIPLFGRSEPELSMIFNEVSNTEINSTQ